LANVSTTGFNFFLFRNGASAADSTGGTTVAKMDGAGNLNVAASYSVGAAITVTNGTAAYWLGVEGTAFSSVSGGPYDGFYSNSANHCLDIINNNSTDLGCALGVAGSQTITGIKTFSTAAVLGSSTATTQTAFDNSTKVSTTAHIGKNAYWLRSRGHDSIRR
jgi:hypothetical protein